MPNNTDPTAAPLTFDDLLDRLCPEPLDACEGLAHLDRAGLLAERQRLRLRLLLDPSPDWWLLARAARLEEALSGAR